MAVESVRHLSPLLSRHYRDTLGDFRQYNESYAEDWSTIENVNKARKQLLSTEGRSIETLPPTQHVSVLSKTSKDFEKVWIVFEMLLQTWKRMSRKMQRRKSKFKMYSNV